MSRNIMLDIECLSTAYNAVITQIGLQAFYRDGILIDDGLSINIQIQSCLDFGLLVDAGALKFWWEHTPTFLHSPLPLPTALGKVRGYLQKDDIIWSHSTFDIPIIANAYNVIKQGMPFNYRNTRDIRTLVDLSGINYKESEYTKNEKSHCAFEDCLYQIKYCVDCFKRLGGKG